MSTKTLIPAGDDDPGPDPYALRSASAAGVPVAPMLSMFDPIYLGIDEFGHPVYITLIFRNLLGKPSLMGCLTSAAVRGSSAPTR